MTQSLPETDADNTRSDAAFSWRRFAYGALIIFIFVGYGLNYLFYNIYSVTFYGTYVPLSGSPVDVTKHHALFMRKALADSFVYIPTLIFAVIAICFFARVLFWKLRRVRRARAGN